MRGQKFSLYRKENTEVLVSNWTILGYTLPSIGIFVMLMAFIIEPYMAYWGTFIFAWWLVPIIIISSIVLFIKALKKNGILKRTVLRLSLINLLVFLFLIFVRMPIYNCDAVEMAKHYDKNTEKFDELITYAYSPSSIQNPHKLNRLLRKTGCISIDTSDPNYCDIVYKCPWDDGYSYRIYLRPMTTDEYETYLDKSQFIPHNDKVIMMFEGGVTGRIGFSYEQHHEYRKKYPTN